MPELAKTAPFDLAGAVRSVLEYLTKTLGIDVPSGSLDSMVDFMVGHEDVQMYMSAAAVMADFTQSNGTGPSYA